MNSGLSIADIEHSIIENTDELIAVSDHDGILRFVNKAYSEYYQRSVDDFLGRHYTDGLPEEKVKFYNDLRLKITSENTTVSITRRSGPVGKEQWISWRQTGIYKEGVLVQYLFVGRNNNDIIELQREQREVMPVLLAYRKAIDTNIICTITDKKGVITYANDNFCKISQFSQDEVIGRTHSIVNSGFHAPQFFTDLWKTILSGNMWTGEVKNKAKDGSYYWVNSVIIPIKDSNDNIASFLSIRILINDQKHLQEERDRYTRSIEEMIYLVSHEIRRPIVNCQGLLNFLEDEIPPQDEYDKIVAYMKSATNELDSFSRKLNDTLHRNFAPKIV